ncbi:Uncharacterised protein [Corynebacterium striatum]|nr:Uncharacterised protein [Corynebacterium striatum]
MSFESLIVKLKSGATYYFPAGSVSVFRRLKW